METTLITKKELAERIFDGTGFQIEPVEPTTNPRLRFSVNGAIKAYSRVIARLEMIIKFELPHMGIRENTKNKRVIFHDANIIYVPSSGNMWNEQKIIEHVVHMRDEALVILRTLDMELNKDVEVEMELLELI